MNRVDAALERIRDLVNSPRRSAQLREESQAWLQLCSAMDVIGDTALAVDFYLDAIDGDSRSDGRSYLYVYGILQVLYVQQDAARTLARSLKLLFELPPELAEVREIRNTAIGHPTARRDGSSAMISRITLTPEGFQLFVHRSGERSGFEEVTLRSCVARQIEALGDLLEKVADQLVAEELAHRRTFRDAPLSNLLPHTCGYMVEKVADGLRDPSARVFASAAIESLRSSIKAFIEALAERGLAIAYADTVIGTAHEAGIAIDRLGEFIDGRRLDWTRQDGDIYWHYLEAKMRELQQMAGEIDAEYASDAV
jgi:hypothetical protein